MALVSDNHNIEKLLTYVSRVGTPTSQATAASTLTLTATSAETQIFTGSTAGQIVKLPDATTIAVGWRQTIYNASTATITLQDNAAGAIFVIGPLSSAVGTLQTAGSAAGVWIFQTAPFGVSNITTTSLESTTSFATTSATDVVITSMTLTPTAGTYAIWFNGYFTISLKDNPCFVSLYKAGSIITNSARSFSSGQAALQWQGSTISFAQFDGTQACDVRIRTADGTLTALNRSLFMLKVGA